AVGDDEYANPDPADARHDLDFESAALYNAARRVPAVSAQLRIMDGGHDWSVWQPGFEQAMSALGPTLSTVPPTGLGDTRYQATSAGGVSEHAVGMSTTDAIVVGDGWTTKLATDQTERLYGVADLPDGGVLATGYTKGDLDGRHPGNTTDDAFVASLDAGGKTRWITQFGVAGTADRIYGLATAPDGGAYVAGYTQGALDGANAGDKDAFLARVNPDGTLAWTRQLGGTGEDKAYGVAADAQGAYVVGSASAALPGTTALGGLDGWVAAYGADGARRWVTSVGGADDDRINGVAISGGKAVITGLSGGDLLARAYTAAGRQSWTATVSTPETDEGAAVVPLADGGVRVVGYTRGRIGVPAGGADVLAVRFDARGRQQEAAQLGTARDDGVDAFGEPNLYASATRISGITGDGVFLKADR
ncbi:MAG: esterase, partial [Nonomuraea sp.]|nr:esterase [Nonomuraea sp.]